MTTIPGSVSQLTPEWLTKALRGSGVLDAARVISVNATPIGDGNGMMSQVTRLRLSYDGQAPGAPATLIAKLPPEDAGSRSIGVELGFFEHEARFYQDFAVRTAIRGPRCYFVHYDPSDGAFLTLLQDLSGARLGNLDRGCSLDDGAAAMRALAGLHTSWWNSPELAGVSWLQARGEWLDALLGLIDEAWPTFVARFGRALDEEQLRVLASVHGVLSSAPNSLSDGPSTLLHGDFKLDNMFFDGDGDVTVFDWGLAMTGPAAFDVAFFLGLDFNPPERRRYEGDLIRVYVDALATSRVHDYAFDRCVADYRAQLAGLLPQLIVAGGRGTFLDEEAQRRYARGLHRVLAAVSDHHALELVSRAPG